MIKTCITCKKKFETPFWRHQKFCSRNCANSPGSHAPNWRGGKVEKVCFYCGKIFMVRKYREQNAKYCSRSCNTSSKTGVNAPHWKGGGIQKKCPQCEKPFFTKRALFSRSKYCSRECQNTARTKRTAVPCPTCGTIRMLRDSELKRGRVFCGMRCYRLHRPTSIESAIRDELTKRNIYFVPEYKIKRWSIDIFIPSSAIAIECDGEYWHRDKTRDERKDIFLQKNGIKVFRFAEKEIRESPSRCVDTIIHFI